LNKDVQKLLWKNKMKFLKADSVLKSLGLTVMNKTPTMLLNL
jgi:tRNA-dihydrouridine synthase 3